MKTTTAAQKQNVALTRAQHAARNVGSTKVAASEVRLEGVRDRFESSRVANGFWKTTGRLDEAAFVAKFGDGGMRGGRNAHASDDWFTDAALGIGGMVGGQTMIAGAHAAALASGVSATGFGTAFMGGVLIGLGINQATEALTGDSIGGILGEMYGDAKFEEAAAPTANDNNGGAGEPNPDAPSSSNVTLHGATGGKLGSKPETKTTNGAGDPAQGTESDRAVADDASDVKDIRGCERMGGDLAVVEARSLARIALLANAGCRIRV